MLKSVEKILSNAGKSMKRSAIREIRFEGQPQRLMYELDKSGRVLTLFTFSKIFAPGFRVGWVIGNPEILDRNVAFVSGSSFFCNNSGRNTMRLNFSFSNTGEIEEGVKRISQVINDELKGK
jgi:2-aminoadipate transaminase